jgi:hypothetical protein
MKERRKSRCEEEKKRRSSAVQDRGRELSAGKHQKHSTVRSQEQHQKQSFNSKLMAWRADIVLKRTDNTRQHRTEQK